MAPHCDLGGSLCQGGGPECVLTRCPRVCGLRVPHTPLGRLLSTLYGGGGLLRGCVPSCVWVQGAVGSGFPSQTHAHTQHVPGQTYKETCTNTQVRVCTHMHAQTCVHANMRPYTCTHKHAHTHAQSQVHTHRCAHTHSRSWLGGSQGPGLVMGTLLPAVLPQRGLGSRLVGTPHPG